MGPYLPLGTGVQDTAERVLLRYGLDTGFSEVLLVTVRTLCARRLTPIMLPCGHLLHPALPSPRPADSHPLPAPAPQTLLWILRIVSHRNDLGRAGWSRATCVLVGLATAPLGIAFELVWNAFLAVVTFVTIVPACRNGCSGVNAHSDVLSSITGNWHPLLKYDSNARIFEMSVSSGRFRSG